MPEEHIVRIMSFLQIANISCGSAELIFLNRNFVVILECVHVDKFQGNGKY